MTLRFSQTVKQAFNQTFLMLVILGTLGLAACSEYRIADEKVHQASIQADNVLNQIAPKNQVAQALSIDSRPYYGARAVPMANSYFIPAQFEQPGAIVMTFARGVNLNEFTRMVQSVTGIRTNFEGNVDEESTRNAASQLPFLPSGGEQVSGGRIVWQGRLSDLLNQAADHFRADWRYNGSAITFSQQVTRTFMLHSLASELSISGSVTSGATGGSTASNLPQVNVSSTASLSVWKEIEEAVDTIMGDNGEAAFSPSTGTITITSTPDIVRRVEHYLNQQNAMRLRRVAVGVKVLSVTLKNTANVETDFSGALERAIENAGLTAIQGAGSSGLTFSIIKDNTAPVDTDRLVASLNLENSVQRASITHSGALMTLSDQPAPLQVGRQISYLARTSASSGTDTTSVSLEPGTVDTGLMMTVLPRIVEQQRILMRVSVAITDLTILRSFGSENNQIQLPEVETTGFLQNAVLTSGETLVLAGFEKDSNSRTTSGSPGPLKALKSKNEAERGRTVTVLLLTADILPEEPMSIIGQ